MVPIQTLLPVFRNREMSRDINISAPAHNHREKLLYTQQPQQQQPQGTHQRAKLGYIKQRQTLDMDQLCLVLRNFCDYTVDTPATEQRKKAE